MPLTDHTHRNTTTNLIIYTTNRRISCPPDHQSPRLLLLSICRASLVKTLYQAILVFYLPLFTPAPRTPHPLRLSPNRLLIRPPQRLATQARNRETLPVPLAARALEMGRKAAPQPLALPSQSSYQSQTDTALRSQDDPQDIETSPCVSPAGSRSPRSTRSSPFHSRFSPLRNQGGNHRKVSQATDALSSIITTSTPASSTPSVAESESKRDRYPQGAHPQSSPEDPPSACYPSISSALDHRPQAPGQPTSTAATTQSESTRSSPSDPRKVTKNGFFHFNKPSNSLNQPPHVLHQQNPSEERNQIMSRGSDGSSRPRHGGM